MRNEVNKLAMLNLKSVFLGQWDTKTLLKGAWLLLGVMVMFVLCTHGAYAADDIGKIAANVMDSFENLAKLITAASYLAGLGFAIGAIMKFKQHKDNPTQIPIGTPIALVFIAAALLFLPSILGVTGATIFGSDGGKVGSPSGVIFGGPGV
jgi:intracellular multiplication protein IcmD